METAVYTHEKGQRVDVHRPSAINPGDYEYISVGQSRKLASEGMNPYSGGPAGVCHHCGKAIVWEVHYKHIPSGNHVTFGYICAGLLDLTDSRIKHEMMMLQRRVKRQREEWERKEGREEKNIAWRNNNRTVYEFVRDLDEDESFDFLRQMKQSLEQWGSLTDGQTQAVSKILLIRKKKEQERKERLANAVTPTVPLQGGRQMIEGKVTTVKAPNSDDMFPAWKMRVVLDNGNAVWGTIPASLRDGHDTFSLRDERVSFEAEITVSSKDQHFGFIKRPTKAKIV